jgi:hypothetical protein
VKYQVEVTDIRGNVTISNMLDEYPNGISRVKELVHFMVEYEDEMHGNICRKHFNTDNIISINVIEFKD